MNGPASFNALMAKALLTFEHENYVAARDYLKRGDERNQ